MRLMDGGGLRVAAGFGAIAGMRSMFAPALLGHRLSYGRRPPRGRHEGEGALAQVVASRTVGRTLDVLAAGELVADKLPWTPSRIQPLSLAVRAVSGGLAGAALASRRRGPKLGPVLVGVMAAVGSAFAAYHLRRLATLRLHVPNAVAGVVEDAIVLAAGVALLSPE